MRPFIRYLLFVSCASAFVPSSRRPLVGVRQHHQLPSTSSTTTTTTTSTRRQQSTTSTNEEVDQLKHEIEEMKAEALRRMQALELQLSQQQQDTAAAATTTTTAAVKSAQTTAAAAVTTDADADSSVRNEPSTTTETTIPLVVKDRKNKVPTKSVDETSLLDGTRWKVMLNVGREPGTWMPKTWGISGERLLINVEVEFTSDQLYEREEFLNGITNAKELEVHHVDLGPTLSEDCRHVKFKDTGGWRIAPGEGPMGTDVLRFYIEIEEDVRHQGSDVYCPKGRIYCTCGYFPMHRPTGVQDQLKAELDDLAGLYDDLSRDMETSNMFDKLKVGKEMLDVRMEIRKVTDQLNEARVREPEKALLRLSRKRDVGLTKEGGLCVKVAKGLAVEYHILGKFGVASIEKREDFEERKLQP